MDINLVSIIIPVYNAQEYLDNCIKSVVEQTYADIEILLVDNGSTDNSREICDKWAKRDARIRLVTSPNGVSRARNCAIGIARGQYICFVDSDDWVEHDLVECAVSRSEPEYFLIFGYYLEIYGAKKKVRKIRRDDEIIEGDKSFVPQLFGQGLLGSVWNKLYDAAVIKNNGLLFREGLSLGEDIIFNIDYLEAMNGKIKIVDECRYHYIRRNIQSLDHKFYANFSDIQKEIYGRMITYIDQPVKSRSFQQINILFFNALVVGIDNVYQHRSEMESTVYHELLSSRIHDPDVMKIINDMVGKQKVICSMRWKMIQMGLFPLDYFFRNIVKRVMHLQ